MMSATRRFTALELILILLGTALTATSSYYYFSGIRLFQLSTSLSRDTNPKSIGKITPLSGTLRVRSTNDADFKEVSKLTEVFNRDVIVTDSSNSALLTLEDGSEIKLEPRTMIQLEFASDLTFSGFDRPATVKVVQGSVQAKAKTRRIFLRDRSKTVNVERNSDSSLSTRQLSLSEAKAFARSNLGSQDTKILSDIQEIKEPESLTSKSIQERALDEAKQRRASERVAQEKARLENERAEAETKTRLQKFNFKIDGLKEKEVLQAQMIDGVPRVKEDLKILSEFPVENLKYKIELKTGKRILKESLKDLIHPVTLYSIELNSPGKYEIRIEPQRGDQPLKQKAKKIQFYVTQYVPLLEAKTPLVGGHEVMNNQYTGKLIDQSDITLRWNELGTKQLYRISIYRPDQLKKPVVVQEVSEPRYTLKQSKSLIGKLNYRVTSPLENGFIASSRMSTFEFKFLPPKLQEPKNGMIRPYQETLGNSEGQIASQVLTWEKTNFTESYEIQISTSDQFDINTQVFESEQNFLAVPLKSRGTYVWRVRSIGKNLKSPFSSPYRFTMK
jgi:hypothetical protein